MLKCAGLSAHSNVHWYLARAGRSTRNLEVDRPAKARYNSNRNHKLTYVNHCDGWALICIQLYDIPTWGDERPSSPVSILSPEPISEVQGCLMIIRSVFFFCFHLFGLGKCWGLLRGFGLRTLAMHRILNFAALCCWWHGELPVSEYFRQHG